jgi:RimJ/RimL family protein N-acetyltransferase
MGLNDWNGAAVPQQIVLDGTYVRLEPLDPGRHAPDLFEATVGPDAEERFRYLAEGPPSTNADLHRWTERVADGTDPMFFAVVDKRTGRAVGRQALMRIDPGNGVIEVGNILWGHPLARTRGATEALFLFADYAFRLGYRRFEWKCNDLNQPSKRAAERFGFRFEGVFRQHMVVKGHNRDTAWFAIIDSEWPGLRAEYRRWLSASNFDNSGQQLSKLSCDGA